MRILVTGGSGFVGKNLVRKLVDLGYDVTITSSGTEPDIPGVNVLYKSFDGINWSCVEGKDVVFHQAANNDTRCKIVNEVRRANVISPMKLFYEAYKGGCRKFIYASSTAVYGSQPAPYVEDVTKTEPLTLYGRSKLEFDNFAAKFAEDYPSKVIGLRYCNVYGPGEGHKGKRMSMIGQMMRAMMCGVSPKLFEHGEQRRDWIYVKDVVEANICAMNLLDVVERPYFRIFNTGSGTATSFNDIVSSINETIDRPPIEPEFIPCPFASEYQEFTQCDMKRARDELGFVPRWNLRLGIEDYYNSLISSAY